MCVLTRAECYRVLLGIVSSYIMTPLQTEGLQNLLIYFSL